MGNEAELQRLHCYVHNDPLRYTCGRWTTSSLEELAPLVHGDLTPRHVLVSDLPRGLERNGYRPMSRDEEQMLHGLLRLLAQPAASAEPSLRERWCAVREGYRAMQSVLYVTNECARRGIGPEQFHMDGGLPADLEGRLGAVVAAQAPYEHLKPLYNFGSAVALAMHPIKRIEMLPYQKRFAQ